MAERETKTLNDVLERVRAGNWRMFLSIPGSPAFPEGQKFLRFDLGMGGEPWLLRFGTDGATWWRDVIGQALAGGSITLYDREDVALASYVLGAPAFSPDGAGRFVGDPESVTVPAPADHAVWRYADGETFMARPTTPEDDSGPPTGPWVLTGFQVTLEPFEDERDGYENDVVWSWKPVDPYPHTYRVVATGE